MSDKPLESLVITTEGDVLTTGVAESIAKLRALGLEGAAKTLETAERMRRAYGAYLFVTPATIARFNDRLREDSQEKDGRMLRYKQLVFIPLAAYGEVPPAHALAALEAAQAAACFDRFEVAKIEWVREVEDPILFGVVEGCQDRFFISQWDDDVKVEDLLFQDARPVT